MSQYNYITVEESQSINYYRIPKQLFSEEFIMLSTDSKLLYGLMLERTGLSKKNGWINDEGFVYIIYTVEELMHDLNCSNKSVNKYISELKEKGLIEIVRRGLGKPNIIFVKSLQNVHFKKCKKYISRNEKSTSTEVKKVHGNKTDMNKTDMSNTLPPIVPQGTVLENEQSDVAISEETETMSKQIEAELVSEFEIFWKLYPKKTGKGKAKISFKKIMKRKNRAEICKLIALDLEHRKLDYQWQREDGRFIPNPSTYLNQERWLDEYEIGKPKSQKTAYDILQEMYEEEERKKQNNEQTGSY